MSESVQPRIERGFRAATRNRPLAIFFRVINGPRGMRDGWRKMSGQQMPPASAPSIELIDEFRPSMIMQLNQIDQVAATSDTMLLTRAERSDCAGRPAAGSMPSLSRDLQRKIDDRRRYERDLDHFTGRRRCRALVSD